MMLPSTIERKKVTAQLAAVGLAEPVRILPHVPTMEEIRANFVSKYDTDPRSETLWLFYRKGYLGQSKHLRCRVQRLSDGRITGTCGSYKKNRNGSCPHIGEYCIINGLDIPGGGFNTARRNGPSYVVHPDGVSSSSLRNKAYREMGQRVRELAFSLVQDIKGVLPPWPSLTKRTRKRYSNRGRSALPLRVILYAAIVKTAFSLGYHDLRQILAVDPYFAKFGWNGTPNYNAMCDALAHPHVYERLRELLTITARPGRNIDFMVLIDASGLGTTISQRWRKERDEFRHGEDSTRTPADDESDEDEEKQSKDPYVKVHTLMGAVSQLVYALDVTMNFGEGSADTTHFMQLLERAAVNCNFDVVAADKGYHKARHYAFCDQRSWLLFAWLRKDSVPETAGDGARLMAFMDWLRRDWYHVFVRFHRLRPLIEAVFSSQKRRTGHVRLQLRKWEIERIKALDYPYRLSSSAPEVLHEGRRRLILMIAEERVGYAHRCEAYLKAISANLRALVRLEKDYRDRVDLRFDKAFRPMRRIALPNVA